MAKRKRLSPLPFAGDGAFPDPLAKDEAAAFDPQAASDDPKFRLETKSIFPSYPEKDHPETAAQGRNPPIASIAAEVSTQAALDELAEEIVRARAEGRMILRLPLASIDSTYLMRDRMDTDPEEMEALVSSIRERGQQTAIEVADLGIGADGTRRYGLISGWRRLRAIESLAGQDGKQATVLAVIRHPEAAADAYLAMIEENEIRSGLSFYERGRIAVRVMEQGIFASDKAALLHLFRAVPRARRSKIRSFVELVRAVEAQDLPGPVFRFPTHLSERQGLAIVAALKSDPDLPRRLAMAARSRPPATPEDEAGLIRAVIGAAPRSAGTVLGTESAVARGTGPDRVSGGDRTVRRRRGNAQIQVSQQGRTRLVLEGEIVSDPHFCQALTNWIAAYTPARDDD